jgi:serine/threonine protein kinase
MLSVRGLMRSSDWAREAADILEEPAIKVAGRELAHDRVNYFIGRQLNSYKLLSLLGVGGMGEVYRAEDTSLKREVAIKVLPDQFTQDPERLARFEREAQLLAQLNHPNIAAIYGLEEADGVRFFSLELVEGETLAERVAKGPLPVEEALEVCRQITEGVEAAHEKGVIHRDLKPANVKITPEGKVKILDFGMAKAFEGETAGTDPSQSPTLTDEMTRAGVIWGTAAYMSPEQAKGKPVDKRADIFAFGCVLYECLAGKRVFEGQATADVLGAIVHKEPNWALLPADTPWKIRDLLRRCLEKDLDERLPHVGEAKIQINKALKEPATGSPTDAASFARQTGLRWIKTASLAILIALSVGLAFWTLMRSRPPGERPATRFSVTLPTGPLPNSRSSDVAISPDGRQLIYSARGESVTQLYVRSLDEFVDRPIAGTENVVGSPFLSPDGESVAFFAGGKLKTVSLTGGQPITLCEARNPGLSGSWGPEATIIFSAGSDSGLSLFQVPSTGGELQILATPIPRKENVIITTQSFCPTERPYCSL